MENAKASTQPNRNSTVSTSERPEQLRLKGQFLNSSILKKHKRNVEVRDLESFIEFVAAHRVLLFEM